MVTGPVCTKYGWQTHATFDEKETACGHKVGEPIHAVYLAHGVVTCEICREYVMGERDRLARERDRVAKMLDWSAVEAVKPWTRAGRAAAAAARAAA